MPFLLLNKEETLNNTVFENNYDFIISNYSLGNISNGQWRALAKQQVKQQFIFIILILHELRF